MKRAAVEKAPPQAWGRFGLEILLGGTFALLLVQLFSAISGFSLRWLFALPVALFGLLDVRSWHWTWIARASLLKALYGLGAAADVRNWSWVGFAGACAVLIVVVVALKAWRDRSESVGRA